MPGSTVEPPFTTECPCTAGVKNRSPSWDSKARPPKEDVMAGLTDLAVRLATGSVKVVDLTPPTPEERD